MRMPSIDQELREAQPEQDHLGWLLAGPARDRDGGVRSWSNPSHGGFPYLEAAGLLLSLHAEAIARGEPGAERLRADGQAIVGWLMERLQGGVVRHRGALYAFDTAIVVAALDRWRALGPHADEDRLAAACAGGRQFLIESLRTRRGQRGAPADGHWSRAFGPHLLKLAIAVDEPALLDAARRDLLACWDGGRFRVHAESDSWYPHAHAYALEGLLAMRARGVAIDLSVVDAGLATLRQAVLDLDTPTDVAAQLIRLGLLRGWSADDEGLSAAWRRLADRRRPGGGLTYRPGGEDVNTWVTVFSVQAMRWSRIGADPAWLA